jgi:gliding motility-associated-like protein
MKLTNKLTVFLMLFVLAFASKLEAQTEFKKSYVFSSDSIAGFDEAVSNARALENNIFGEEYKFFMYHEKRNFIKQKYNLKTKLVKNESMFLLPSSFNSSFMPPGGACNNEDFELATSQINAPGAVQGWTLQSGSNNVPCVPAVYFGTSNYTVFTAPTIDPKLPFPVSSYFDSQLNTTPAGNSFLKLNNATLGAKAAKASKAFIVTPSNALFQYAYLPVVQDGGHNCCTQPGFSINITVTNTVTNTSTVLACPKINVSVPSAACTQTIPSNVVFVNAIGGGNWKYANWVASAIDLTPYLNNLINIDVEVVDCTASGHGAYVYFDAKCAPMDIIGNGNPFPAGTPSITLPTCGANGASIIAPAGLGPYSWAGPGVGPPYSTPLMTNQNYTTTISANYTLTMNPPGSCFPIKRVITVSITPAPQLFATSPSPVCGSTVGVVTFTAAGSAANNPSIVWSPTATAVTSNSTPTTFTGSASFPVGTGQVTVTATDQIGCAATATAFVSNAPPLPTFSVGNISGSNSITCWVPAINYTANTTYTFGSLSYSWTNGVNAPLTGSNVSITNASNYSVTAWDPATNCAVSNTLVVFQNLTVPSATLLGNLTQNITCTISSVQTITSTAISPTANIQHLWVSPTGGTVTAQTPTSIFVPGGVGTFTHYLVNVINGCSSSGTFVVTSNNGFPTYNVTSPQQFTLGCGTKSVATINIINAQSTPPGAPLSYTLLGPPTSSVYNLPLSQVSNYTVNTPGTWTVITADNSNLCETKVEISVISNTIAPPLAYNVAPTRTLTCFEPKTVLQGSSTNTNVAYSWAFPWAPGQVPNDTITAFTGTNTTNTVVATYTLSITDNSSKCRSTETVTIYQNIAPPIATITPAGTPSLTCLTPTILLTNASFTNPITAPFAHNQPVIGYMWSGPSPQVTSYSLSSYVAFTPGSTLTGTGYTMVALDRNNGCTSKAYKSIVDNRIYPIVNTPNAPAPYILDCGPAGTSVATISPIMSGNTTGFTYSWVAVPTASFSSLTTSLTTVNMPGEYNIYVTNPVNGCVTTGLVEVINGTLVADFVPSAYNGYAPLNISFTNLSASSSTSTPTASITSVWSFGNGGSQITTSVAASPATIYTQPGTYTVTMYASKGQCKDTVKRVITVDIPSKLEVPNVFTPNGDGSNDVFFLKVANITEIYALIYDRWGNKVFESTSNSGNIEWDGKNLSDKECAAGTYFYIIKATGKDGLNYEKKGNVSLYK